MARRVRLPGADDIFRATEDDLNDEAQASASQARRGAVRVLPTPSAELDAERAAGASGRVRHAEKMTVYVTSDELLAIEQARLTLRRHGLVVDRGRLVREAIHLALDALEDDGSASPLVQRLADQG